MTDPIVPPVDPSVDPAPVAPVVEPTDEELAPGEAGTPPEDETPEQLRERLAASEEARRKLYARLQREKNKGKPATPATPAPAAPAPAATPAAPAQSGLSRDEAILIAQGHSLEELDKMKTIAAVENIPLLDVPKNDIFTSWKKGKDEQARAQSAQLGASRGSKGSVKKTFNTPGLSDEDHKALFKDKVRA
jgi:hypothetical protein